MTDVSRKYHKRTGADSEWHRSHQPGPVRRWSQEEIDALNERLEQEEQDEQRDSDKNGNAPYLNETLPITWIGSRAMLKAERYESVEEK